MIETLLLASALAGCVEREARSFEELVSTGGQPILECETPSYTELAVFQSFSMDGAGSAFVRFEFVDLRADTVIVHEISPCRGFDIGEDGIGESLLTEVSCNGKNISLQLGLGALTLKAGQEELFSYPVATRYVSVNEMIYEMAQLEPGT